QSGVGEKIVPSTLPDRFRPAPQPQQDRIGFGFATATQREAISLEERSETLLSSSPDQTRVAAFPETDIETESLSTTAQFPQETPDVKAFPDLPPLDSALKFVHEVAVESLSSNIRPLGQLDESFIIAT